MRTIAASILCALFTACGGSGELEYLGDVTGVVCPADPATFVGPLQPECLPQ